MRSLADMSGEIFCPEDYDDKMRCGCGWQGTFGDLYQKGTHEVCPKCLGYHCLRAPGTLPACDEPERLNLVTMLSDYKNYVEVMIAIEKLPLTYAAWQRETA